jgi:hypothetical protein
MNRRLTLATAAIAASLALTGTAFADQIPVPAVGRGDCGVQSGTITVLEPGGPTLAIDGAEVDVSGCIEK